jgi:hypothetical protein
VREDSHVTPLGCVLFGLPLLGFGALGGAILKSARGLAPPGPGLRLVMLFDALVLSALAGLFGCGMLGYGLVYAIVGPSREGGGYGFGPDIVPYFFGVLGPALLGGIVGLVVGWKAGKRACTQPGYRRVLAALHLLSTAAGIIYVVYLASS